MSADAAPLVVHVIHHLVVGGMENTLVNLINHCPPERFRHAVLCIEDYSDFRHRITRQGVEVVALHRSKVGAAAVRRAIFNLCRSWRPAIVHSRNLSGLDALLPAWLARVPVRVHSEHGWDVDNLDGSQWRPRILRRLHSPLVTAYVTVSQDLARFLQHRVGISRSRITQIYNGVDTDRFVPHPGALPGAELPPGFANDGAVRIGTVGRIQPVKDQATLIRAFGLLIQRRPELRPSVRLLLIGDGPLLERLRAMVVEQGIADIAWLPGNSHHVPQLLQAMDLFVLPSLNEGVSNTILEAMASGLPVVASRVGGNPELVVDGECGRLFEPQDAAGLSAILEAYVLDPALRLRHALAARARAECAFSLAVMIGRYADLYAGLAGTRRGRLA